MSSTGSQGPRRWVPGYYDYSGNWVPGRWQSSQRGGGGSPGGPARPGGAPNPRGERWHPLQANQGYGFDSPWEAGVYGGHSGLGYGGFGPYGEPYGEQNLSYQPDRPDPSGETWGQSWDRQIDAVHQPQRSDDELREAVVDRLARHGFDLRTLQVAVANGEVTLTGEAGSRQEKRRAEATAESVGGVRDVHNRLRLNRGVAG